MHYLYWLTYAASIFVIISISWFGFLINQLSFFYTSSLSLFLLSTFSFYFLNWKQVNFIIIINRFAPDCYTRKLWENLFEKHYFFCFSKSKSITFFISDYRILHLYIHISKHVCKALKKLELFDLDYKIMNSFVA